ncbi:MAG: phosphoenolpyruvate--protein phosphotransferase [Kiritimatiellia bacterium]
MSNRGKMRTIAGLATARGFAVGPAFIYRGDGDVPIPQYVVEPGREAEELLRFHRAVYETKRDIEGLIAALRERGGREDVRVFECHQMLLEDVLLLGETERCIRSDRVNAETAVRRTANHAREQFGRMNDPYFRERVRDIDDVERRLLRALTGFGANPHLELKRPSIVVADDLTPSETVQLPREFVLGFATDGGSTTSHVALLARAMGIPAVTGLGDITGRVVAGETLLLDGTNGTVTVFPDAAAIRSFTDLVERQKELVEEVANRAPAGTLRDGGDVPLYANVHPGVPVEDVREHGARGIGLYRSEYLWLNREREPSEAEQFEAYRDIIQFTAALDAAATVTIRTLDIGGDKLVRGISTTEANPFLGNRSIRYLLSHPDVFTTQLRAILRASAFGKAMIMYPMVSCVDELHEAAKLLATVKAGLDAEGVAYDRNIPVGAMVEVPSAAISAGALAKHVDFFSIGTNDLVQYTMAADRGNETVAHLYQPTNPAVLQLMRLTIAAAKRTGIPVSVCGESASDPIVGVLWAAMGVDNLSMSATYIPLMSKLFSRLTRADLDDYAQTVEAMGDDVTAADVMAACQAWMRAKIPDLDNIVL